MSRVMTGSTTLQRLGVLDHGETAVRVLHAVGVLNSTDDAPAITTVLFHDERDRQPWFGREADEAVGVALGSIDARRRRDGGVAAGAGRHRLARSMVDDRSGDVGGRV